MQNRIRFANECAILASNFILCMFCFITAQVFILGDMSPWYIQLTFLLYLLFAVAIRIFIAGSFPIYIGLHLFLFVTLGFLPLNNLLRIEFILYLLMLTVQSIQYWHGSAYHENLSVPWPTVLLLFLVYIYAYYTGHPILFQVVYVMGTLYLLLYLLRLYMSGLHKLSVSKMLGSHLPLTQITRTNTVLVGILLAIMILAICFANLIHIEEAFLVIGKGLLFLFKQLLRLLRACFLFLFSLMKSTNSQGSADDGIASLFGNPEYKRSILSTLFEVLWQTFQILFFSGLLYVIFRGMYRLARQFLSRYINAGDTIENLAPKKAAAPVLELDDLPKRQAVRLAKIRKKYKKEIEKHKAEFPLRNSMTTTEIENRLTEETASRLAPLKKAYEDHRYGNITAHRKE